jgi:hypothetical protein
VLRLGQREVPERIRDRFVAPADECSQEIDEDGVCEAQFLVDGLSLLWKPMQLSSVAWLWVASGGRACGNFGAMRGLLAFVPGHLVMVALHGWSSFASMLVGWRFDRRERQPATCRRH